MPKALTMEEVATLPMLGDKDTCIAKWVGDLPFVAELPASFEEFHRQVQLINKHQTPCQIVIRPGRLCRYIHEDGVVFGIDTDETACALIARTIDGEYTVEADEPLINAIIKDKIRERGEPTQFAKNIPSFLLNYPDLAAQLNDYIKALQDLEPRKDLFDAFPEEAKEDLTVLTVSYFLALVNNRTMDFLSKCAYTVQLWTGKPCPDKWHPKYNPNVKPIHLEK